MAEIISVEIRGSDGVTKVFQAVEQSATRAGRSVESAGKQGAQGMKQLDQAVETTEQRLKRLEDRGQRVGGAVGTMVSALSLAGSAHRDQSRQIEVITRLYDEQAESMLDLAETIQDTTRFSNDAARESLALFGSLGQAYGITEDQTRNLLTATADLATAFKADLGDAATRVSAGLRGEAEALEAYGITLNDTFVAAEAARRGLEGWTTTMTDAEKAAFRYTLLMEQVSVYQGLAEESAQGAGGALREFINDTQDMIASAGGAIGPIADMAAELQGLTLLLPIVGAGLGKVMGSMRGYGGPALAIGGIAAGTYLAYSKITDILNETEDQIAAIQRAEEEYFAAGDYQRAYAIQGWKEYGDRFQDLNQQMFEEWGNSLEGSRSGMMTTLFEESDWAALTTELTKNLNDSRVDVDAYVDYVNDKFTELYNLQASGANENDPRVKGILEDLNDIDMSPFLLSQDQMQQKMEQTLVSAEQLAQGMTDLTGRLDDLRIAGEFDLARQFEDVRGVISQIGQEQDQAIAQNSDYWRSLTGEDRVAAISAISDQYSISAGTAEELAVAEARILQVMESGSIVNAQVIADIEEINAQRELYIETQGRQGISDEEAARRIIELSTNMSQYVDQFAALKGAQVEWLAEGDRILDWWLNYNSLINQGAAAMDGSQAQMNALQAAADFRLQVGWADDIRDAATALDGVLAVFGRIDELGQRSQSAGSIAESLVGEPGVWSEIDNMLNEGRISLEEYNDAVTAGHAIQESNLRTQELLNDVRRDQLPLLAEEQAAYEANLARLSELEPAEQRRVLMLQDMAAQSQIASLYSTAYAASIGEIPEEVATRMILEAAEADAGLKDILLNLGLIQENADGTISVSFPEGESVTESIFQMTDALIAFMDLTDDGKINGSITLEVLGIERVQEAEEKVTGIDGTTATASVEFEAVEPDWAKDGYMGAWGPVKVPVELDWAGMAGASALDAARQVINTVTVDVVANTEQADSALATTQGAADALDGTSAGIMVTGENSQAMQSIGDVSAGVVGVDGMSAGIVISGDNGGAMGAIGEVQDYDGVVLATSYHDIVTRYSSVGTPVRAEMMGGVVSEFAMGGVTIRAGEVGPEVAHFPMGGTALLPHDGFYNVPANTYISPHNGVRNGDVGGITIHAPITVQGHVIGVSDLTEQVMREMAPAMADAMRQHRRSMGGA
jgi:hypothetical protein